MVNVRALRIAAVLSGIFAFCLFLEAATAIHGMRIAKEALRDAYTSYPEYLLAGSESAASLKREEALAEAFVKFDSFARRAGAAGTMAIFALNAICLFLLVMTPTASFFSAYHIAMLVLIAPPFCWSGGAIAAASLPCVVAIAAVRRLRKRKAGGGPG